MDIWAFLIIAASGFLYFVSKRKPFFLLTAGIGIGILVGAIWGAFIVRSAFG